MSRIRIALGVLGTLALLCGTLLGPYTLVLSRIRFAPLQTAVFVEPKFSWETLPASKELIWRDCFVERQCARLIVPLNHSDTGGAEAIIAIIRKPSALLSDQQRYRGPILFNPGGPGGSGVELVQGPIGDLLSTYVGPQFDILSFDPRGIGLSTPRPSFFKTDSERAVWGPGSYVANNSDEGVARTWARARVMGQLAAKNDDGTLQYLNTEQTARDMLSIVEAHGRSKLQYWGFSYGTVLNFRGDFSYPEWPYTVFELMVLYQDKIERLVLDGVVDADNYVGVKWSNNLIDADKVLETFFVGCASAGPDNCRFWAPTARDIRQNLTNLYESIRSRPLPVKTELGYGIVDYGMLRSSVFVALYSPYASFQTLARNLAALAAGDPGPIFDAANQPLFECACEESSPFSDIFGEASTAIFCNDNLEIPDDLGWAEDYFKLMANTSDWGDIWSNYLIACQGWPRFSKTNFRGPFEANTSYPILFIGNTADPVTPLWAANHMSQGFVGSVVLTQDSAGHSSVSAPSLCTQNYVRQYFVDGSLPDPGTVCSAVGDPFPDSSSTTPGDEGEQVVLGQSISSKGTKTGYLGESEKEILVALAELSKLPFTRFRFQSYN